jgi:predicted O-methyltransferase YrrM
MFKLFRQLLIKYTDHRLLFAPAAWFLLLSLVIWYLAGALALPLLLTLLLLITTVIQIHLYRKNVQDMDYQQRNIQALIDLHNRIEFRQPLPSLGNWTASPELITTLYSLMHLHQPGTILELGSGASSICAGYFCEHLGTGKVITVDHNAEYTEITRKNLNTHQLNEFVQIRHAPLKDCQVQGKRHKWYDISMLDDIGKIDMLVIDGPPLKTQKHARYPALPLLHDKLSDQAVILLDDAARREETEIIKRWLELFPEFESEFIHSDKGLCILTRKSAGNSRNIS